LRRDGPENIREVFEAELGGVIEIFEFGFDFDAIASAFDFGFARAALHEFRAFERNFGGARAAVVDGLRGAGDRAAGDRGR